MADSNARSNPVNVEQIMEQIRGRIREQRGVEYTEQQILELAAAQLEKYLDPTRIQPNLLEEFRRLRASSFAAAPTPEAGDDAAVFQSDRTWLRMIRFLLRPITRLFVNTKALATVLLQSQSEKSRRTRDQLLFELVHNLVVETTRLGVEVKNLKMRNESLAGRIEFNERRARALEGAMMPARSDSIAPERSPAVGTGIQMSGAPPAAIGSTTDSSRDRAHPYNPTPGVSGESSGQRRRRRRRRGRRGGGQPASPGGPVPSPAPDRPDSANSQTTLPADSPEAEIHHGDDGRSESDDGGSDIEPQ